MRADVASSMGVPPGWSPGEAERVWDFRATRRDGTRVRGQTRAHSREDAVRRVEALGYTGVTAWRPWPEVSLRRALELLGVVRARDRRRVEHQLRTMCEAGLAEGQALALLVEHEENRTLRRELETRLRALGAAHP